MRKETAWAIGIGIIFGLILAFGLWRINLSIKNTPKQNSPTNAPAITPVPTQNIKISIQTPENGDVITTDSLTVVGKTTPDTKVVINTNSLDYLTISDNKGLFSKEIKLDSGVNRLSATAIQGEKMDSSNVLIVYSASFENKEATDSATLKPKSYIGTVTDITDTSIQIKTVKNEIKQISISEGTSVANLRDTTGKAIKLTDIAIGDSIAGLGFINSASVLSAQRVLVINPISEDDTKVVSAKFVKGDLKTDKNTLYYDFVDNEATKIKSTAIKEDSDIIYITIDDLVRTVFVIKDILN